MTDETDHVFDAALALDVRLAGKTLKPESDAEIDADNIPEDATEVPDRRDVEASRIRLNGPLDHGE